MSMTPVLDRGDNTDSGCNVPTPEAADAMQRALRDWKWEVIAMVTKHNNMRYCTDYVDSDDTIFVQVTNPVTGEWMNS